jgi:hypothetical protein
LLLGELALKIDAKRACAEERAESPITVGRYAIPRAEGLAKSATRFSRPSFARIGRWRRLRRPVVNEWIGSLSALPES